MSFTNVIGQARIQQSLCGQVHFIIISHALLFLGNEGSGALPLALAFAQYPVCESPLPADACGVCPSCVKARQLIHPDIHFSYPVIPKKAGDKPVSTDYISEWREFMAKNPYGNTYDWLQFIRAEDKQDTITPPEFKNITHK